MHISKERAAVVCGHGYIGVPVEHSVYDVTNLFYNNSPILRSICVAPDGKIDSNLLLDQNYSVDLDERTLMVVDSLRYEFPLTRGCSTPDEALSLIRSRFEQYGDEVDSYVDRLSAILNEEMNVSESDSLGSKSV